MRLNIMKNKHFDIHLPTIINFKTSFPLSSRRMIILRSDDFMKTNAELPLFLYVLAIAGCGVQLSEPF